tara:strand:+ start:906 stop:1370 length:465 start_codon:yes stop_codon:yes gene_type:complete
MDNKLGDSQYSDLIEFFSLYYKYPTLVENVDNPRRVKSFRKMYREIHGLNLSKDPDIKRWINLESHEPEDMSWLMKLLHSDSEGIVFSIHENKYTEKFLQCFSYFPGRRDVILVYNSNDSYIRGEYTSSLRRNFPMAFVEDKLGVVRCTPTRIS